MGNHCVSTQLVFSLLFLSLNIFFMEMGMSQNTAIPVKVGVILNMDTYVGKMSLSCISMALSDFYASHGNYKTRLVLNTRDSKNCTIDTVLSALDLIENEEVLAFIGSISSTQADFIINLGDKSQVPIVAFSATSPSLSSIRSPYFFRVAQNDSSQVNAISAIIKAYGWREAVPIYVDNEFGEGVIPFLTDALKEIGARVPYRSVIPPSATDDQIEQELYKLMTMQTRVFIVHMLPSLGSRLFAKAKEIGMMSEGYVWIVTDAIGNILSLVDESMIDSMQGVLGLKTYVQKTVALEEFRVRWKRKFQQDNPTILNAELSVFGLWAYDAATALAIAVEKVSSSGTNFTFQKTNISDGSTNLETFGISQTGPQLRQALLSTTFKGLAGDFHLIDGQIQSSAFQIVNVIGNGERGVGFWTPENGLSKKLSFTNTGRYSTSKDNLGVVLWSGETTSLPKGWAILTNGKSLRIGVLVKDACSEFVKVMKELVFDAVLDIMPYAVPNEFIPYELPNGTSAGSC